MVNGRKKGVVYEQRLAQTFRDKGWSDCLTSRHESKRMDDLGVDLVNTKPFNVQAKAVEKFGRHHETLKSMPQDNNINVIFHKRNNKGTTVTMLEEDFWTLVNISGLRPISTGLEELSES